MSIIKKAKNLIKTLVTKVYWRRLLHVYLKIRWLRDETFINYLIKPAKVVEAFPCQILFNLLSIKLDHQIQFLFRIPYSILDIGIAALTCIIIIIVHQNGNLNGGLGLVGKNKWKTCCNVNTKIRHNCHFQV